MYLFRMNRFCFWLMLILLPGSAWAQDADWILGHDMYHYLDRLDILGYVPAGIPTELKPFGRKAVAGWMREADQGRMSLPERNWHHRLQLLADDSLAAVVAQREANAWWAVFGRNQRDFYSIDQPGFRLYVNPLLHLSAGLDRNSDPQAARAALPLYNNLRGLVLRGSVGERLGFYTEVGDYLTRLPQFQYRSFAEDRIIPGEGFIKPFGEENGVNYFQTRAYLTLQAAPWLRIKFGKDRVHWGNGWQSLWLSEHAADGLMLNLNARFWKLEYVSHLVQMIDYFPTKADPDGDYPRKYGAFHAIYYRPGPKLSIGIFEANMFSPFQPNGRRGFELQYLNPVMFYRAAEQYLGSPDNGLLGLSVKTNWFRTLQLYGQLLIDDYNFGNRVNGPGYWGNQWAVQGGLKYLNAFTVPTLDLQLEYNLVRPYVYQHFNVATNYLHYGQPLGHGAGANLQDWHLQLRYHPFEAWNLQLLGSWLRQGRDLDGLNYGWDPTITYVRRPFGYGNVAGQGEPWDVKQLWGRLTWQVGSTEMYLEAEGRYRREQLGDATPVQSVTAMLGLRVLAVPRQIRY